MGDERRAACRRSQLSLQAVWGWGLVLASFAGCTTPCLAWCGEGILRAILDACGRFLIRNESRRRCGVQSSRRRTFEDAGRRTWVGPWASVCEGRRRM
ncbi:hypothetical protein B0H13DRAFT_2012911, partial [Mycena leptocephala]